MPVLSVHSRVCQNCMKREGPDEKFPCCSRCKTHVYCSRNCQVEHWPKHKNICRMVVDSQKLQVNLSDDLKSLTENLGIWLNANVEMFLCDLAYSAFYYYIFTGDDKPKTVEEVLSRLTQPIIDNYVMTINLTKNDKAPLKFSLDVVKDPYRIDTLDNFKKRQPVMHPGVVQSIHSKPDAPSRPTYRTFNAVIACPPAGRITYFGMDFAKEKDQDVVTPRLPYMLVTAMNLINSG